MKEQDAANSFDKRVDAICEVCKFNDAIHYDNDKYFCCGCFAKELTRLRSELQQERELVSIREAQQERNQAIDLFREVLSTLQSKEAEYKECSVESNPNWEYFKGKADAYEFAVKQLKRVFEWNDIKITENNQLT